MAATSVAAAQQLVLHLCHEVQCLLPSSCVILLQDGAAHTASRMCIPSAPELLAELEQLLLCPISHVRSPPAVTSQITVGPHNVLTAMFASWASALLTHLQYCHVRVRVLKF